MSYTLRQIADALWQTGPNKSDQKEADKLYDRTRMLRDRGLIQSSQPSGQGRASTFTEADAAAALLAITASLNGSSWGTIQAVNQDLRKIGNTQGTPEFERQIADICEGKEIFVRLDIFNEPWAGTRATMGDAKSVSFADSPIAEGTTQVILWPITRIAKPVLERLKASKAAN